MSGFTSSKSRGLGSRLVRPVLSIVVLTAFVLGLSLFIKEMSTMSPKKIADLSGKLLSKLNIKVDEKVVGEVAGELAERVSSTNLGGIGSIDSEEKTQGGGEDGDGKGEPEKEVLRVGIISDIHEDYDNLTKTIDLLKRDNIKHVFVLGDLTNYGTVAELEKFKKYLDDSGLSYFVIPGDHDLAQSVGPANFLEVFGKNYYKININGVSFVVLDNSPNFTLINASVVSTFKKDLAEADFVMLSQPIYVDDLPLPFGRMFMGSTKTDVEDPTMLSRQKDVLNQRNELLEAVRSSSKLKAVFAGDHHRSSKLDDPVKGDLSYYTVGAISSMATEELSQKAIQTSRFSVLTVNPDGTYKVSEILLD